MKGILDVCDRLRPARRLAGVVLTLVWFATVPELLLAQNRQTIPTDGPPPPIAPAVISRDETGMATVRAVRLTEPLRVDGRLDESVYATVPPIDGFIQQEPRAGEPGTERTDVWVLFDDNTLYVTARLWDTHPELDIESSLQRDGQLTESENFVVMLDTFHDRRNGFYFQTNLAGAVRDQLVTDEGNPNTSWDTVWSVRTARFDGGWSLEMEIPFKSLRYSGSGPQIWGVNFRRTVRWKNEVTFLTKIPSQYGGPGIYRLSMAATMVGLETPAQSKNLELKPYAVSSLVTDRSARQPYDNRLSHDVGGDLKYGLTKSLIADVTYNTDFAQVEEDLQQVNLTRFNLRFPEKRDFFLEGQGIFAFGGASASGGGGLGGGSNDVPVLFFSRQIGLNAGQEVPVIGGGRVTGKAGQWDVGALDIVTGDAPAAGAVQTNFAVTRLKRGILRQSYIGMIAAHRSPAAGGANDNLTVGADLNLVLSRTTSFTSYYARTRSPRLSGDESSYRGRYLYSSDRYGLDLEQLQVGREFNPEVGFLSRTNSRRSSGIVRFSPRPRNSTFIRKYSIDAGLDYITDAKGKVVQSRQEQSNFSMDMQNGDGVSASYTRNFEFVETAFNASSLTVPRGQYNFDTVKAGYSFGLQRPLSGNVSVGAGSFYSGTRRTVGMSSGRIRFSPHLELEPNLSVDWISLPGRSVTSRLASGRVLLMPSNRMLITALVQFNSSAKSFSSNARLKWEYTPGSELFVAYSDGRTTEGSGFPGFLNRSLTLKITRLFRL